MRIFLVLLSISFSFCVKAQIDLPPRFSQKLDLCQVQLATPLEHLYKTKKAESNPIMPYDFAMYSKKEKLEIRYHIIPFSDSTNIENDLPQMHLMRTMTNVASNDEEAVTTVHSISEQQLKEDFNADWGVIAFFPPKASFSNFKNCKLLCLFKENKGIAFVYYLFDEPVEALDYREQILSFK